MVVPLLELIETDAATLGFTVIESELLVAVEAVTQAYELVKMQLITSPFCRPVLLKAELFVPDGFPLTNH